MKFVQRREGHGEDEVVRDRESVFQSTCEERDPEESKERVNVRCIGCAYTYAIDKRDIDTCSETESCSRVVYSHVLQMHMPKV